jgi:hypothetical protein
MDKRFRRQDEFKLERPSDLPDHRPQVYGVRRPQKPRLGLQFRILRNKQGGMRILKAAQLLRAGEVALELGSNIAGPRVNVWREASEHVCPLVQEPASLAFVHVYLCAREPGTELGPLQDLPGPEFAVLGY